MKSTSYALKSWWPRRADRGLKAPAGANPLDRAGRFRRQVELAARRARVTPATLKYVLDATDRLPAHAIRPDLGRQAQEWVARHRKSPCAFRSRRERAATAASRQKSQPRERRPLPDVLARESLVLHLREQERLPFRQIAVRLATTPERVRQVHARALSRARRAAGRRAPDAAALLFLMRFSLPCAD